MNSEITLPDSDILSKLTQTASQLKESDLDDWILEEVLNFYQSKIDKLAYWIYADSLLGLSEVARSAFREQAKAELRNGLNSFFFRFNHWESGRDLNPYLLSCLNKLAQKVKNDLSAIKRVNVLVCPACKFQNRREFLIQDGGFWKCEICSGELDRFKNGGGETLLVQAKIKLTQAFALHSRSGKRCPKCERFIPDSIDTGTYGVSCPFPDCDFFGVLDSSASMQHPVGSGIRSNLSLNDFLTDENDTEFQDMVLSDALGADTQISLQENFDEEIIILKEVLVSQRQAVERINAEGTIIQKLLLYDAFNAMLEKYPEDMVAYLVHRRQDNSFPIQARVFQEYANRMLNALPFSFSRNNVNYDIYSLTDPNIQLFTGISSFEAEVGPDNIIPNLTKEVYVGSRGFKYYGPCFIGLIIDVIDKNSDISIKHSVDCYSFTQIKMKPEVVIGTPVVVKHFRLDSHYEVGALVYLQRIKKKIVDAVYYRLNGEKRNPGE